ncbi:DNA topoisomerase 3 [Faecalibacterium prausnitzii]|nr:DNA topoisomerase 3 [Faecalibacterium prausnitzii]
MAKLIVTEKPSVAMAYAKVLGAHGRQDGYLEGSGYLISWCVGHLVELAPPSAYGERYVKWNIADLPILPEKWQYLVSASTKKQFFVLKKLLHRADVETVVNSCDAGREGELIFRLVYEQAGCRKPVSRLWLSSMEDNAIREGFANLKPSTEYDALYQAALCRERADWMVGINCSRLFSCLYGRPLAVGRVMTPTLAMTVEREAAIAAFVPEKFYTVALELTSGFVALSRRISEKDAAEKLLAECRKEMVSTIQKITRKEKAENPPPLYDLTTLQRDANRLLGYSAHQTLKYAQSLYEKKLTTYPRTDSCYIADEDEEMLEELAEELEGFLGITPEDVDDAVPRTRRTVNREKVADHHAILPTRSMLQADLDALPKGEQHILKLIIARTLMAVSKPFRYLETLLTTECAGEEFTAKGKEILDEGWKAVERKVLADILSRKKEFTALPPVEESECGILNAELKEGQTSPPKHFTEDTLLHSMETASADSMPEDAERQGIGTPVTRAAIIEKLVAKGFLERKGDKKTKVLLPTDKGKALITVMPEEVQSADMTADWETKLLRVERGEMEPKTFMTEINDMISSLVNTTEAVKGASALMKNKVIGICPNCGKSVVEREKGYFCENRECRFVLWKDNAFFKRLGKRMDAHVADKLLRDGRVRLKDCRSAKGKTYNATVLLTTEADGRSKFSLEFEGSC